MANAFTNFKRFDTKLQQEKRDIRILLPIIISILNKKAGNICFIICHQHETRSGKINANKTKQISVKTFFFVRAELQHT